MLKMYLYFGDTFRVLKAKQKVWKGKFRNVFADPPYFVSSGQGILKRPEGDFKRKGVRLYKGDWDSDISSWKEIYKFNYEWMKLVKPLIAKDGTIWICGFWNFNLWTVRKVMEDLGYDHLNNITIIKPNAVPNLKGVRFASATEDLIWAKPWKKRYFAYQRMKKYHGPPDSPRGKQMKNYWIIPVNNQENVGKHTTQKAYEMIRRCILATTDEGDWVLDPFSGTCSTMKVCKDLHRNCACIEQGFYFPDSDGQYRCTCGKRLKTQKDLLAHHSETGHKRQFVRDIEEKIGWGVQALDDRINYKKITKYFRDGDVNV